jgi:hypothetical protein
MEKLHSGPACSSQSSSLNLQVSVGWMITWCYEKTQWLVGEPTTNPKNMMLLNS